MKNTYFNIAIICLLQLMSSCSSTNELKEDRKIWKYKNWDKEFKSRAFCLCQLKGYESKNLETLLLDADKSYFDPIGIAIFDDSLEAQIKKEVKLIRLDSINSVGRYPTDIISIYQKRNVLRHCIEFYNSKRLDSLMNLQKKYWRSIPNIMNKIHDKIPTY